MTETEKLLGYVQTRASICHEGHYTIVCSDGLWYGQFDEKELDELFIRHGFKSIDDMLNDMLQNEKHSKP